MNLENLNLSAPMLGISSEGAVALGDLYDDFGKHCASASEARLSAATTY